MHRSERPPLRRSSRSELGSRTSLVSSKSTFLDTLFVSKSNGAPAYATITQSGSTVLYAIDTGMTLHRVAAVDWGQSGSSRKNATIAMGGTTRLVEDIFPTNRLLNGLVSMKTPARKYTYGDFACSWVEDENHSTAFLGASRIACYKSRYPSLSTSVPRLSTGQAHTPQGSEDKLLVAVEFYMIPHKPKIQIHVYARDLLGQTPGEDELTELDHVVLGALLLYGGPITQRKGRAPPEGWMDEEALQNLLWSSHAGPADGEIPPLYAVIAEAIGDNDLPPPYASRVSVVDRQRNQ
ncbi:hypothetical protein FRC09_009324 [Ceratobasidium sp. 395]|nr:hypothetical protein FRC09_009324 [Ceratobasidium sp. 395]